MNARKYLGPNRAWSGKMCPVISLFLFLKETLIQSGCFRPSLIRLSGMSLVPKDVRQVYQLNWGIFCALIRSGIVTILACLDLFHAWILVGYLLDHAGISPQQRTITIVIYTPVDDQISHWYVLKRQYKEVEHVAVKITKLSLLCYNSICLMCGCWWHILPLLPLSYSKKENR
jgi:hypothetical protein